VLRSSWMHSVLRLTNKLVRPTARLLIVALTMTTAAPLLHGGHDADCDVFVWHDASQHRFTTAPLSGDDSSEQHCIACHLQRAPRGPVAWEVSGVVALERGSVLLLVGRNLTSQPGHTPVPARAPPSLS
jgi:hypothetical protein